MHIVHIAAFQKVNALYLLSMMLWIRLRNHKVGLGLNFVLPTVLLALSCVIAKYCLYSKKTIGLIHAILSLSLLRLIFLYVVVVSSTTSSIVYVWLAHIGFKL